MKLAYHSLGSVDTGYGDRRKKGYPRSLRRHFQAVSRPDTEIELWGTSHGGIADSYRYFAGLDTYDVLTNAMELRSMDVNALIIGNIFDPGLRETRELLSMPVIGQLETSVLAASMVADEIGIVSINDKQVAHSRDKLRMYGFTDRIAAMIGMDLEIDALAAAYTDEDVLADVLDELEKRAAECVDEGAEVLIPGGGILSMLLPDNDIREFAGVPIIDQVAVTIKMAETMVDLYEMNALETSKVGTYAMLDDDRIDELRDEYNL